MRYIPRIPTAATTTITNRSKNTLITRINTKLPSPEVMFTPREPTRNIVKQQFATQVAPTPR
jgi:hypothetical protein